VPRADAQQRAALSSVAAADYRSPRHHGASTLALAACQRSKSEKKETILICKPCGRQDHENCEYVKCPCQHVDAAQRSLKEVALEAIERERLQPLQVLVSPSAAPEPARVGESNEE
jgi:hypothetical protein